MAKRSNFARRRSDYYPTPQAPITKITLKLWKCNKICEPCAGDGRLAISLVDLGFTIGNWSDKEPKYTQDRFSPIPEMDLFDLTPEHVSNSDLIVTNPPWPHPGQKGQPTIDMVKHMISLLPTWVLLSSDFAHNVYFNELSKYCVEIYSVGRVSWQDNGVSGKDNAAWYHFDKNHTGETKFSGNPGKV